LLKARNEHSVHSPFVFDFYTKIIKDKTVYPDFEKIEILRKELKCNFEKIEITDFGAGSGVDNSNYRAIASISKYSEKKPSLAQLIFRIIKNQQPATILDLGTSLGITTLYESKANPSGKVYTFEGCPNTALIAKKNFEKLSASNIEIIVGNIDSTLPELLKQLSTVDFVFFDANHRYEPTVNYFHQCLEKATEDSVFIFDDIYWSPGMKKAWEEIKHHPSVGISIDLFFIGILFFRKKQPVQHFTLK
jgi:predicted O-methyltransferase YrrM